MNHDVFISYSSRNPEVAQAICHILEEARIKCWIAPRNIPAGVEYGDLIDDAIIACKVFLFIYSSDSVNSVWCRGELNDAFSENKIIIPYRIDTTPLKGAMRVMLNARHWLDAYPDYETQFSSLVEAINRVLGKPSTPTIPEKKPDNSKQNITEKVSHVSLTPRTFQVKGVEFTMIPVEGGTFTMGATSEQGSDAEDDEKPAHRVTLSDYYIGETEVTQALWQAVMGDNPSYFQGDLQRPVEHVSWNDCQEFIKKLNALTGRNFRLPTEAEWEYAARGGNKSKGYKYAGSNTIGDVAWYDDNSNDKTHPVKGKQANELGLYDMSGNVGEWCSDLYRDYGCTTASSFLVFPIHVYRGGSWDCDATICRVSTRISSCGDLLGFENSTGVGLRLALSNPIQLPKANFEKSGKDNKDIDFNLRSIRVNGVEFNMIPVKGGTFIMGATPEQGIDAEIVEKPTRQVSLGDYYIGETVVTQALWRAVMGYNPSCFKGPNLAVDNVSWYECKEFIARINKISGLNFNLPTEAEWEYAARGGNMSNGYKYAGSNDIEDVAWFDENSSSISHSVKTKKANELGIYDMSGTIWEWCYDWATDYSQCTNLNPMGPTQSTSRKVLRGGAYSSRRRFCRVSSRSNNTPETKSSTIGFRITLVK